MPMPAFLPTIPRMAAPSPAAYIAHLRDLRPPLSRERHKGQAGRVAIIGGSEVYTGAPFYAAMAALRSGSDLSSVFTAPSAAPIIKGYSPDLMVYPSFDYLEPDLAGLSTMHAAAVGPGLGRSEAAGNVVSTVLDFPNPVVCDADALWFLRDEERVAKLVNRNTILTPNKPELNRLLEANAADSPEDFVARIPGLIIVEKGPVDRIISQDTLVEVHTSAARKRVGGQGDILCGVLTTFAAWGTHSRDYFAAAVAASAVTRTACRLAYNQVGRSLVASDVLPFLGAAVEYVLRSEADVVENNDD